MQLTQPKPRRRRRRHYTLGYCQDCGHSKPVTTVTFWLGGMRYRVCSECIKPYRASRVILLAPTR